MRRLWTVDVWIWGLPLLLCAALLVSVDAPAKPGSDSGATAAARLSGRVQYWRWSPPLAGIKLLEDILGRVRSVPQLAMKTNLRMQNQEVAQQAMQGPTNYQLAIRPRESSWPQQAQRPTLMGKEARQAEDKDASAAKAKRAAPAGIWEKDATLADAANKRRTDVLAYGIAPAANPTAGFAGKSGIWEAEPKGLTPAQENLRRAASNLYGITRKLDAANQIASGGGYGGGVPGAVSKGVATVVRGELKARPQSAQRQWQVLDEAPIVRDSREKGIEEFRPSTDRGMTLSAMPPVATSAVPMSPDFGLDSMSAGQRHQPPARLESFTRADAQRPHGDEGQASREAEIALLPPNVFTGIPVVRLGSSEAQAARALAAVGSTNRQKINGWTVWSISKPASKDPALQVFMRHGQVDALRIFDGSLVGPDFGVRLGDSLAAVKERFGQPAFIIPEPTPGSGQNYVYPISQVAFLMARPAPNEAPVVTGLFLFTVK